MILLWNAPRPRLPPFERAGDNGLVISPLSGVLVITSRSPLQLRYQWLRCDRRAQWRLQHSSSTGLAQVVDLALRNNE